MKPGYEIEVNAGILLPKETPLMIGQFNFENDVRKWTRIHQITDPFFLTYHTLIAVFHIRPKSIKP